MTEHTRAAREAATIRAQVARIRKWVRRAAPREHFVYHCGLSLALDRMDDPIADAVGHEATRLAGAGFVQLAQRRAVLGEDGGETQNATNGKKSSQSPCGIVTNDYIMVRTRRPMTPQVEGKAQ